MALLNPIGRRWCTWLTHIWLKNKCHAPFGSMLSPMPHQMWMPSRVSYMAILLLPFCLFMALATTSAHGYPFSPYVTFIMKRTGTNSNCMTRLTCWMVSSLAILLLWMHSWCITPPTSNITNLIVTVLTPISSRVLSTLTSNMTAVCSVTSFVVTTPEWKESTLLGLGLSALTPPLTCCWWALSWISLSQMISQWILHFLILFSLTMVFQRLSLSQRWLTSFPSPRLILFLPILKTLFYLRSFASTLKSLTSTTERITKVILTYRMVCIGSFSNLMSTNVKKIGVSQPPNNMGWHVRLIPGHVSHTFLYSSASPQQLTFDPVALFVSAVNLHCGCPSTLLRALAGSHPDCKVWLVQKYYEKKGRNQKSWDL